MPDPTPEPAPEPAAAALLHWYDRHRRTMPWRAMPGQTADPYHVWLSEIMLQQTTVAAVGPYFRRFLERFPTVQALAAAPVETVMEAWAGLGYYARARNMHACARMVAASGAFPSTVDGLRALPGVGAYTAAAIASIAFGIPVIPVDGNVERVASRIFAIDAPLPASRPRIAAAAARLGMDAAAAARPSDFTQALFDLGATICTPRNPACALCPWRDPCRGRALGDPARLPVKAAKRPRPIRHGAVFWMTDTAHQVLLRRRPATGLLGGMLELPGTAWTDEPPEDVIALAPQTADWRLLGQAVHGFTHFELHLDVYAAQVARLEAEGLVEQVGRLSTAALPTVMRRCVDLAMKSLGMNVLAMKSAERFTSS